MELSVLRRGMLTTVQDLGRYGHRRDGVPSGGAMDSFALRVANLLVGNGDNAAGLECTLVGPKLLFSQPARVAVCGASFEGVPSWQPFQVKAGEQLDLGSCRHGARAYLAVRGGIETESLLGSRSTYVRGRWGGFEGRALREGDVLKVGDGVDKAGDEGNAGGHWRIDPRILPAYSASPTVRVIPGLSAADLAEEFFQSTFEVTPQSDRMGIRLRGPALAKKTVGEMLSRPVVPGTVQLPPDGSPVVLMADAQTIGGYPQIAHVITVDLPLVAQLRPGNHLRFTETTVEEAHRLTFARERALGLLHEGLAERFRSTGHSVGP
jgi:antagonist of KipI